MNLICRVKKPGGSTFHFTHGLSKLVERIKETSFQRLYRCMPSCHFLCHLFPAVSMLVEFSNPSLSLLPVASSLVVLHSREHGRAISLSFSLLLLVLLITNYVSMRELSTQRSRRQFVQACPESMLPHWPRIPAVRTV